ncbi:hypothetical protein DMI62_16205 [Escherichia coli]|nr:hypothetical protein [Escherichia coli]
MECRRCCSVFGNAPKVRLSLQSLNCYVIRDALLNDEADVGVLSRRNDDALNPRKLGEQPLVLVASPQIADVDFTELEDITPVALLSTNHNVSSGRYLRARCASGGSRWKTPLSL